MQNQHPVSFSGVIPSLAQVADFGPPRSEVGIGCLMPWLGKLYVLNYVSHRRQTGSGTGLRVIEGDMSMRVHPEAVDGTYANRYVHTPSSQLIIGPHLVDTQHSVRTVSKLIDVRLCGTAAHLSDPQNLVYMLGMEGELFELNVHTLAVRQIFDLGKPMRRFTCRPRAMCRMFLQKASAPTGSALPQAAHAKRLPSFITPENEW